MAKQNTDTRANEADAYAPRAKQDVATTVRAERSKTAHNPWNIRKLHDRRLTGPTNYANAMAAKVAEG